MCIVPLMTTVWPLQSVSVAVKGISVLVVVEVACALTWLEQMPINTNDIAKVKSKGSGFVVPEMFLVMYFPLTVSGVWQTASLPGTKKNSPCPQLRSLPHSLNFSVQTRMR